MDLTPFQLKQHHYFNVLDSDGNGYLNRRLRGYRPPLRHRHRLSAGRGGLRSVPRRPDGVVAADAGRCGYEQRRPNQLR